MSETGVARAGWYPDPDGSGGLRYWDGRRWTHKRKPAPAVEPTIMIPAGWYPDPDGSSGLRYWDGRRWTRKRKAAPAADASTMSARPAQQLPDPVREVVPVAPSTNAEAPTRGRRTRCACMQQSGHETSDVTTTVTLVHGTFARHGKWVQPQAALPSALRESPGTLVQPCCWSGQNLQSSRFKGARKLHDHLINLTATYPLAAHFVVAHSHGGNVAMYALRSPDGTLDERLADVHIITLSTPFITAERQRLRGGGGLFILVSALFLTFWQLLLALSTLLVMDVYRANPELSGSMWVVLVTYGILFFAGFMVLLPIWLSPLVYREQPSAKLRYVRRVFGGTADESTRRIQGPELDSSRLTIFRAPGDEASGLLGLTHLLTWLSRRLIAIGWWGVLGISIVAILLSVIPVVLGGSGETFQPLIIGLFTTLFLMSIVLTAVLYGSSIFLGWDTAFLAPHVKMTAESSPLGIAEVRLLETPPGLLAHGIYTSDALVNQVKARVTAGRRTAI